MTLPSAPVPALDYVFHPRSIAIAGVSAKEGPGFGGGGFVGSLLEIGFRGPIFLIHPTAPAIRGIKCYPRVTDVPDELDYDISSVPARFVTELLEDCIAKGVRVLHLFTAGFTETGDAERTKMEQAVVARAKQVGIRLIGPNCMGLYVPAARLAMMGGQLPEAGPVGMVSQSGMNAGEFVRYATPRGIRCSKVISFGTNAMDGSCTCVTTCRTLTISPTIKITPSSGAHSHNASLNKSDINCSATSLLMMKGPRLDAVGEQMTSTVSNATWSLAATPSCMPPVSCASQGWAI